MPQDPDLGQLAAEVHAAQRHVDCARSELERYKQSRATSSFTRFVAFFATSKPKATLNVAEARLAAVVTAGRSVACRWIIATAKLQLEDCPADRSVHQEKMQRQERAQFRKRQVQHWLALAREADYRLASARSACETAWADELLGFLTTYEERCLFEYKQTSMATDALLRASRAVHALAEAFPHRAGSFGVDGPGDGFALAAGLSFDPGTTVLGWPTMKRLDAAAAQCKEVEGKLRPLLGRLDKLSTEIQANLDQECNALHEIEAPYLAAAAAMVPDVLRVQTPRGFGFRP